MPNEDKDTADVDAAVLGRFTILRRLGRGAYGIVWEVTERGTGKKFALKKCFDAFNNSTDAQRTFREILLLQELNGHANIVRLMSVIKAQNNRDIYMISECMATNLHQVIAGNMLTPIHREYITYQVLKALKFMHTGGVLHRDLKPANLLLSANCHVRVCDFGLSRTSRDPVEVPVPYLTDYVATRWYRAPELLLGSHLYTAAVDMWSMGCILGEMLQGRPLLRGKSTMNQLENIFALTGKPSEHDIADISSNSKYASSIMEQISFKSSNPLTNTPVLLMLSRAPEAAKGLVLKLLKFNPGKRLSAEACIEHPYLEKFCHQEPEPSCDKIIRLPIPDTSKMKADDYRGTLYALIAQRQRVEQADIPPQPPSLSRQGSFPPGASPPHSPALSRQGSFQNFPTTKRSTAVVPWMRGGGAEAPPTTPEMTPQPAPRRQISIDASVAKAANLKMSRYRKSVEGGS